MDEGGCSQNDCLPMTLEGYTDLLVWTGRQVRDDKRGTLEELPTSVLRACGLDPDEWLESVETFGALGGFVGHPDRLRERAEQLGQRWIKGQGRRRSSGARDAAMAFAA